VLFGGLTIAACTPTTCIDVDLDGRGVGCAMGGDCDDANAARGADCDAVPAPDCDADRTLTGCPCLIGSMTECFPGPVERVGVGVCRGGRARCIAGHWGPCTGSETPGRELCDGGDQDCDGLVDEEVRSPCGGCTAGCDGAVWGDPFVEPVGPGLAITGDRRLTLARGEVDSAVVWAVNSGEGTVSRIDSAGAIETARYATGDRDAIALEPSRVAVDWNGDAWVANRAFDATSSVVRIAGDRARCVDRDGDGSIESSEGPDDVRAWGEDECVLASVDVGAPREVARAIAIDGDRGLDGASGGDAWVGLHDGTAFVEIDGLLGTVKRRIPTPGMRPYSAAFDPWGTLWAIDRDGLVARIDPVRETVEVIEAPLSCWLLYGLAIDREGRLAITGFSCDQVSVYDPARQVWSTIPVAASPRGAAFDGADLWVAHTAGSVSRLALDPLRVVATTSLGLALDPFETIGIGSDGIGHVWAISGQGATEGRGVATRIDVAITRADAEVAIGSAPHTQGDPTGAQRIGEPVPSGSDERVFAGCVDGDTRWQRVHLAADVGTHGSVAIEVRHAASEEALGSAPWTAVGGLPDDPSPFALSVPDGGVIALRVTLAVSSRIGAPRVARIGVEWSCPGPD
jgi:hypothetical protein